MGLGRKIDSGWLALAGGCASVLRLPKGFGTLLSTCRFMEIAEREREYSSGFSFCVIIFF
jgi:hypothetical protein